MAEHMAACPASFGCPSFCFNPLFQCPFASPTWSGLGLGAKVRVRVSCVAHRRHEVDVLIRPRLERGVGLAQHVCLQGRVLTVRVHASDDDGSACPWLGVGFC
eukprot:scaffold25352_cov45-Phaeocystis_antarctica.AAC.1